MPPKKNIKRKEPPRPPTEEGATDPANEPAEPPSSDKKKKMGRALSVPNFTDEEDFVLCVANVNVSQNPIKGTDQTSADFWSDTETEYSMEMEKVTLTCIRAIRTPNFPACLSTTDSRETSREPQIFKVAHCDSAHWVLIINRLHYSIAIVFTPASNILRPHC
jgi:hypothetical protein